MDKLAADTTGWDSSWDRLPDIMLLDIFKRLKETDRFNASQVCKHWNRAFNFPDIWRKMKFGSQSLYGERASKFASRFGESLHELEIDCRERIGYSTNQGKFSNFIDFLSILTEKQLVINLQKFVLTNFDSIRDVESPKDERSHEAEKLIQKFLSKQSNVRYFGMEECAVSLEIGLQFLNQLAENSSHSVKILRLINFFAQGCETLRSPIYREIITTFKGLVELHINFNCIDSNILTKIAENCGNSLKVLKIFCKENVCYGMEHVIPNSTWATVRKSCPNLEVDVDIGRLCYVFKVHYSPHSTTDPYDIHN